MVESLRIITGDVSCLLTLRRERHPNVRISRLAVDLCDSACGRMSAKFDEDLWRFDMEDLCYRVQYSEVDT